MSAAPPCWGRQYESHDPECIGCEHKTDCSTYFFRQNGMQQPQPPPVYQSRVAPLPGQQAPAPWAPQVVPQAPKPAPLTSLTRPTTTAVQQQPVYQQPVQQVQQIQQFSQYPYQQTQQLSYYRPNEFVPMPGETLPVRVGKAVALVSLSEMFSTLSRFFRIWLWPPR